MEQQYRLLEEQMELANDILYALNLYSANSKTIHQKNFGALAVPFVRLFETTSCQSQIFCFDLLSRQTYSRINQNLQMMLLRFEQLQTEHTKKEFAKKLIELGNNLDQ